MANLKKTERNATESEKKNNIINFLKELDVSRNNETNRINNIEDFLIFKPILRAIEEIERNKTDILNFDTDARVHTFVTTSTSSTNLAHVAQNVDGVFETLIKNSTKLGSDGDIESSIANLKVLESGTKEVVKASQTVFKFITSQLEKGNATRFQLRNYEIEKAFNEQDKIVSALVAKKSIVAIADELSLDEFAVRMVKGRSSQELLLTQKDEIQKRLDEKVSKKSICNEFDVQGKELNIFIKEQNLKYEPPVQPEKKIKQTNNTKKQKVKTETKEVQKTKEDVAISATDKKVSEQKV